MVDRAREMLAEHVANGELVVPPGNYFAMGDNRDNSLDSRYWGFVPRENIIGKPLVIFWSYDAPTEDLVDYSANHFIDLAQELFHQDPLGPRTEAGARLSRSSKSINVHHYGLILAGGRGTRFWPRSRRARAKQVLRFFGERSLIQQTVDRLRPVLPPERIWILTNDHLRDEIVRQLPEVPKRQILAEPAQRNTAPAIGLAAHILQSHRSRRRDGSVSGRPRDRQAARIRPPAAAGVSSRAQQGRSWCWASSRAGRRPATATSNFPKGVEAGGAEPYRS